MAGILAVAEVKDGNLRKSSFEIVSEALRVSEALGGSVTALVVGAGVSECASGLGKYGVTDVVVVDDERLANAYVQPYVEAIEHVAKDKGVDYIFLPSSARGKAICAGVAARFQTSAVTDCVEINVEGDQLKCKRPVFAGKALATVALKKRPGVLSLRANVFAPKENEVSAEVSTASVNFSEKAFQTQIVDVQKAKEQKADLTEAELIVSGGRGMKGPENFHLVEALADELGGVVGASRAVVDAGWRPHKDQVGQTGKTVSPKLYVACGISGAIQHLAGMRTSKVIVAINKDEEAPIFKVADYGIVGDVFEVLPAMTEEAKKLSS